MPQRSFSLDSARCEALRAGKEIAGRVKLPLRTVFCDGLSGDVARFRVLRALRRRGFRLADIDAAIESELSP